MDGKRAAPRGVLFGVAVAAACVAALFIHWFVTADSRQAAYRIPKTVSYSFTVQNTTNRVVENVSFLTHSPLQLTANQKTATLRASYPYRLVTDRAGNQVFRFNFDRMPPYDTRIVTVRAELMMAEQPIRLPGDPNRYLSPEKFVEADDRQIGQLAASLKKRSAVETAGAVLAWMEGHLKRSAYISENRGARQTMISGEGDCTGFMQLFVALCRTAKIPARCVGGYISRDNAVLKPSEYHNWAEFYADGRWHICDPFNRVFMQDQTAYVTMRIIEYAGLDQNETFDRFTIEGAGVRAKMNS